MLYDKGTLSRDAVLQDRAKYIAAWPERRFTYVAGTLQVVESGPSRYTAIFSVNYWVRNARSQERSGRSHISVIYSRAGPTRGRAAAGDCGASALADANTNC